MELNCNDASSIANAIQTSYSSSIAADSVSIDRIWALEREVADLQMRTVALVNVIEKLKEWKQDKIMIDKTNWREYNAFTWNYLSN